MKKIISFLLLLCCLTSFSQVTTTFTPFAPNPAASIFDFQYTPFRGYCCWQGDCAGCYNLPSNSGTTARDRYYRFVVTDILDVNAASAQFNWTNSNSTDNCFDCEMNAAIDRGGKLAIDVHFQCYFCGGHGPNIGGAYLIYPQFWHNAMQADAVKDFQFNLSGTQIWFPNVNGATFQAEWKQLHQGILAHLNSTTHVSAKTGLTVKYSDAVSYIVVSGYGNTGEWTNTPYGGANGVMGVWPGPAGTEPTVAALDSLIATVAETYTNYYVINQIATFDGLQLPQNTHIPALVGWFALQLKNNKGYLGIRDDGIGNGSCYIYNWTIQNPTTVTVPSGFPGAGTTFHFDTAIQNRWKVAPMVGEPCCPNLPDPSCTGDVADNSYSTMGTQVGIFKWNAVDNGNNFDGGSTPPNATVQQNWQIAASKAGNRMVLNQIVTPSTISSGTPFTITPSWSNTGVAPPYWDWTVLYELKTAVGQAPVWSDSTNSTFNMLGFLPGGPTAFAQTFTKSIPAGTYGFYVTVKDPRRYYDPMPLYVNNGTAQNTDGSYFVRNIPVTASGIPVANAGPNQAITLPTSSVTLTGSFSSGTITSYAWTNVSGPTTPTLTNANTVTCTASGLAQGTYVFRLTLNGGSTSTTQVVVNPAIPPSNSVFSSQVPVAGTSNDFPSQTNIQGVEDGMRFTSTLPGYIIGVRFYKTAGNSGTHIGELYTNTGTRLAQATFVNETGSGWQSVLFSTPVAITANTTYVVAYWSSLGNYVEDNQYFNGTSVTNTQLTAPADGLNGGDANPDLTNTTNGPWIYTASPAFPNNAFHAANYWVDVLYQQTAPAPCECWPRLTGNGAPFIKAK